MIVTRYVLLVLRCRCGDEEGPFDSEDQAIEWAEKACWVEFEGVNYCYQCCRRLEWEYDVKGIGNFTDRSVVAVIR